MALIESFSGIRGIYGRDLTESVAVKYAYAYANLIKRKAKKQNIAIVIGRDTRPSGQFLMNSIISLMDCNFINVGIAPTPAIEFAVRYFEADGGIIITASHNEPYWNGFKFLGNDGAVLTSKEMETLVTSCKSFKGFHKIQERKVLDKNLEAIEKYSEFVLKIIGKESLEKIKKASLKVVLDPNGGSGVFAKSLLEKIGVSVIGINLEHGNFKRMIEPTEDSMVYLKNIIDENDADFAAGFDCDADRVEILMKDGRLMSGHYTLALCVYEALSKANSGNKVVVVNDATSNVVREIARRFNAKVREVEVGETNVIQEMQKSKAIIGGEGSSGGVIIPPSKCRDGILTLLKIISIIADESKKLGEIVESLPAYYTLREKMEFEKARHDTIKLYLKRYYSRRGFEVKEAGGIKGGLKIITGKDSFVWFRASKTEGSIFRVMSDAKKYSDADKLLKEAVEVLKMANGNGRRNSRKS